MIIVKLNPILISLLQIMQDNIFVSMHLIDYSLSFWILSITDLWTHPYNKYMSFPNKHRVKNQ